MKSLLAQSEAQTWVAMVSAIAAFVVAVVGAYKGWYRAKHEEGRKDDGDSASRKRLAEKQTVDEYRRIIADLRKAEQFRDRRIASLEAKLENLQRESVHIMQGQIVQRERADYMEREVTKLKAIYLSCAVPDCPIIKVIKASALQECPPHRSD